MKHEPFKLYIELSKSSIFSSIDSILLINNSTTSTWLVLAIINLISNIGTSVQTCK